MKEKYTKAFLQNMVKDVSSIAGLMKKLGLKASGGNHQHIKSKIQHYNVDISHFTGQTWNKGKKLGENYYGTQKPLNEIMTANCHYSSSRLKHRLLNEGVKKKKCESCGLTHWLKKSIKLELHHTNGDPNDNRLENLEILCPNCHTTKETTEQS